MMNGGTSIKPVPLYSKRRWTGHQLYLGPSLWFTWGGSFFRVHALIGPLAVTLRKKDA